MPSRFETTESSTRAPHFASEAQAKEYFVERVLAQAERDGVPLSEAERSMLGWSESDPDCKVDDRLWDRFERETTDVDFEEKVAALLRDAYRHDVAHEPGALASYRDAYAALCEGDHYILVMLRQALGPRLYSPFAARNDGRDGTKIRALRALLAGLGIVVFVLVYSFEGLLVRHDAFIPPGQQVFFAVLAAIVVVSSVRVWWTAHQARAILARTMGYAAPGSESDITAWMKVPKEDLDEAAAKLDEDRRW